VAVCNRAAEAQAAWCSKGGITVGGRCGMQKKSGVRGTRRIKSWKTRAGNVDEKKEHHKSESRTGKLPAYWGAVRPGKGMGGRERKTGVLRGRAEEEMDNRTGSQDLLPSNPGDATFPVG